MAGRDDPGFAGIRFGFMSAEKEGAEAPELLLDGFFDEGHLTETALSGSPFLFLGYKGSGKTALAEHARLLAESAPGLFVTATTLDRFSFVDFKAFAGGTADHQVRYPVAWGWVLLVALIHSLEEDQGGLERAPAEYRSVVTRLKEMGLLPGGDLGVLVTTSSKQSFKIAVHRFLEYTTERASTSQDLQLYQLVTELKRAVLAFTTTSRHVLFIDGLDSIVTQRDLQFQSLAALLQEAAELNQLFRRNRRPFKVTVLCRTDIFDRLPGANMNKLRQDDSVSLTWFDAPGDPDESRLIRLVNLRAARSLGRRASLFDEFLPRQVDERDTRTLILDHTRHIPRDLVQALRHLQRHARDGGRLNPAQVKRGLRSYSVEYFLPELRDELAGYLDPDEIERSITLLSCLQRPRVTFGELERIAAELDLGSIDMRGLVRALYDASCIGMVSETQGRRPHFTFKYRNPTSTIVPGQTMRIHPGALKALNIEPRAQRPRSRSRPTARRAG
jgi:hypothetical protein